MKTFAIIALLGVATVSHALMIDDFGTGNINDQISAGSNQTFTAATVAGGNRYVYHDVFDGNPLSLSHTTVVTNGIFASDSKTLVDAFATLKYGSNATGVFGAFDMNLNFSGFDRIRINVLSNDQPATIRVGVGNNTQGFRFQTLAVTPNMVMVPQTLDFMFTSFTGGAFNFGDVDRISIDLDTTASGDIVLDSVEAVPEPASMIALGLGVAALISRKRKAKGN
ncbi:MAG: PEP-CTERM sorting domain-containing protein [Fimbriimonadaceae bacterium]